MKSALKIIAAAVLAAAAPGLTAAANATDYRQQVVGYLDTQHADAAAAGFTHESTRGDWVVPLHVGEGQDWNVRLSADKTYEIVGVCDQDCSDVDLAVRDSAGAVVGSDYAVDDHPAVIIRPAFDQTFTVHMSMATCAQEPCFAAARVLSR